MPFVKPKGNRLIRVAAVVWLRRIVRCWASQIQPNYQASYATIGQNDKLRGVVMPKMTTCLFREKPISIEDALSERDAARERKAAAPLFKCDECRKPVRAHKSGGLAQAHFEHLERNRSCSQSHVS